MSENNYGALMMKSALSASVDIDDIRSPGIYPVAAGNTSSPDNLGGVLIIVPGSPLSRSFTGNSTLYARSPFDVANSVWSSWDTAVSMSDSSSSEGEPFISPEKVRLATATDDPDFPPDATLADLLHEIHPEMWKSLVKKSPTNNDEDWSDAIQAAIDYAHKKKKKFVNPSALGISKTIVLPSPINVEFVKHWGRWYALPGFIGDLVKSKNAPEGDYTTLRDPDNESYGINIKGMTLIGGWVSDIKTPEYIGVRDGLRLFGVQHNLDDIHVYRVRGKPYNIGGRDNTSVDGMAPSDFFRLRSDWSGEEAFIFGGSSDSHALMIKVRDAGQLNDSTYKAIRVGQNGTLRAGFIHVWNSSLAKRHAYGLEVLAYDSIFMNCHFEGAANAQIRVVGGRNQFIGFEVYNQWSPGGAMIENLNNSNSFKGRAYIHSELLPSISVHAIKIGDADHEVAFTNVDLEVWNTKLGVFKIENNKGFISGKVVGDTTNYTSDQNRALVVTGDLIDGKDTVIFDTPQYRSLIGSGSVNLAKGLNAAGDINSLAFVYGENAVFRNMPLTLPSTSGTLYKKTDGSVHIKE